MDHVCVSSFDPENDTIVAPAETVNTFVQLETFISASSKYIRT
jgi:hypothetical protein